MPMQDGINSYTCDCAPGYEGDFCSNDVDECATGTHACQNGGTCKVSQQLRRHTHCMDLLSFGVDRTTLARTPVCVSSTLASSVILISMSVQWMLTSVRTAEPAQ